MYKVLHACNQYDSYAIEELENRINQAARDGYKLVVDSSKISREDRGQYQVALYHATAVMIKDGCDENRATELKTMAVLP